MALPSHNQTASSNGLQEGTTALSELDGFLLRRHRAIEYHEPLPKDPVVPRPQLAGAKGRPLKQAAETT
jgi:hypothetical protein